MSFERGWVVTALAMLTVPFAASPASAEDYQRPIVDNAMPVVGTVLAHKQTLNELVAVLDPALQITDLAMTIVGPLATQPLPLVAELLGGALPATATPAK